MPPALHLDRISTPPDGPAQASGIGCVPNSLVRLFVGSQQIGQTVADSSGAFRTSLQLNVAVGRHTVVAQCGITLSASIDVVLSTHTDPPTSTGALLLFLLLVIVGLVHHQLTGR